ncbi:hypothetical protein ACU9PU_000914 [Escherichia coli]
MTTITREQLRERAREKVKSLEFAVTQTAFSENRAELEEELELARIALASLEAEPVGTFRKGPCGYSPSFHEDAMPLYAAPPAPVSVPDLKPVGFLFVSDDGSVAYSPAGWPMKGFNLIGPIYGDVNACRAAMLQGAEPASNRDELPLDYLQGHKDGLEWAAQLAEANHPQTGDWLYDDPIELARAIRKGPDIPEFKSVPVDEDDNFYSWFGRFWYENYQKNNYTTSAKQMLGTMAEFAYRAGRESAALAANSPETPDGWQLVPKEPTAAMNKAGWDAMNEHDAINPTYRAILAAAPQQEVK